MAQWSGREGLRVCLADVGEDASIHSCKRGEREPAAKFFAERAGPACVAVQELCKEREVCWGGT